LDEIHDYFDSIAAEYPEYVSKVVIGETYEGRQISGIRIGNESSTQNEILFHGGIHAREWIGPVTLYTLIYF
jgi:carboxypeptidase A1